MRHLQPVTLDATARAVALHAELRILGRHVVVLRDPRRRMRHLEAMAVDAELWMLLGVTRGAGGCPSVQHDLPVPLREAGRVWHLKAVVALAAELLRLVAAGTLLGGHVTHYRNVDLLGGSAS